MGWGLIAPNPWTAGHRGCTRYPPEICRCCQRAFTMRPSLIYTPAHRSCSHSSLARYTNACTAPHPRHDASILLQAVTEVATRHTIAQQFAQRVATYRRTGSLSYMSRKVFSSLSSTQEAYVKCEAAVEPEFTTSLFKLPTIAADVFAEHISEVAN
jgi:hypothetical protein